MQEMFTQYIFHNIVFFGSIYGIYKIFEYYTWKMIEKHSR